MGQLATNEGEKVMYRVLTNATFNHEGVWGSPKGAYGVARCISREGHVFTAVRWEA